MLLTEAASVPRKDFSSSSLKRMRQCEMVGMVHGHGWAAKYSSLQCSAKVIS